MTIKLMDACSFKVDGKKKEEKERKGKEGWGQTRRKLCGRWEEKEGWGDQKEEEKQKGGEEMKESATVSNL